MQKFLKVLRCFVAPVALALAGPVVAQASTSAPEALVRDLTADVLDTIRRLGIQTLTWPFYQYKV